MRPASGRFVIDLPCQTGPRTLDYPDEVTLLPTTLRSRCSRWHRFGATRMQKSPLWYSMTLTFWPLQDSALCASCGHRCSGTSDAIFFCYFHSNYLPSDSWNSPSWNSNSLCWTCWRIQLGNHLRWRRCRIDGAWILQSATCASFSTGFVGWGWESSVRDWAASSGLTRRIRLSFHFPVPVQVSCPKRF